jgi:hypothetical protein
MESCAPDGGVRINPSYADVIEVLRGFVAGIPVDGDWYKAQYKAVADFVRNVPGETAASHFAKHGYFEGRQPFAPGWLGMELPVPFQVLQAGLRAVKAHDGLRIDVDPEDFKGLLRQLLRSVPVDEAWYRETYGKAAGLSPDDPKGAAAAHFVGQGYFAGYLPAETDVDESWYAARYPRFRQALQSGLVRTAKEHFIKSGYASRFRQAAP